MFKFGEIVHVEYYPYSDKKDGKNRYAVVVSDGILSDGSYVLAAITTKLKNDDYSIPLEGDVIFKPLNQVSEIRSHKLWTGAKNMLAKYSYYKLTTKGEITLKDKVKHLFNH